MHRKITFVEIQSENAQFKNYVKSFVLLQITTYFSCSWFFLSALNNRQSSVFAFVYGIGFFSYISTKPKRWVKIVPTDSKEKHMKKVWIRIKTKGVCNYLLYKAFHQGYLLEKNWRQTFTSVKTK